MRSNVLPRSPSELRAERELQIKSFIEAALVDNDGDRSESLLVVARSPESAVVRAVFSLSGLLDAHKISARIVLMAGGEGERWTLDFCPGFQHEARIATDPRVLDAHEQLVIGGKATWFGDSMRREPEKRDAFMQFTASDKEVARRSRLTFEWLWARCQPLYRHEASGTIPMALDSGETGTAAIAQDVLATLNAWLPSSRH